MRGQTSCTPCGNGQTTDEGGATLSSQCYSKNVDNRFREE